MRERVAATFLRVLPRSSRLEPHAAADLLRDLAPLAAAFAVLYAASHLPSGAPLRASDMAGIPVPCAADRDPPLAIAARGEAPRFDIALFGVLSADSDWQTPARLVESVPQACGPVRCRVPARTC